MSQKLYVMVIIEIFIRYNKIFLPFFALILTYLNDHVDQFIRSETSPRRLLRHDLNVVLNILISHSEHCSLVCLFMLHNFFKFTYVQLKNEAIILYSLCLVNFIYP